MNEKYKVWILGVGETTWATNGIEYDTVESAKNAAIDLHRRWFGADKWAVLPIKDELVGFLSHELVDKFAIER